MKFHSQEWLDAYREASNSSPDRDKKAGGLTAKFCNLIRDCPGGVDKYETWRWENGKVVEAKVEEKPAPSDYRKIRFDKDELLFRITAPYELFVKQQRGEVGDLALAAYPSWKTEGPTLTLVKLLPFFGWWRGVGKKIPTEY
ncbi:MAG: hypothetical protein A2Y59_03225 [Chloroflexi bacterium RBG_13_52_14]|nr:MAG: hypothetical protein A2Y59_03225 [Chloroflexi bacterium RBG_13_52_14]